MGREKRNGVDGGNKKRKGNTMTRQEAIECALTDYPKARRIAVENATFGQEDSMIFRMNLSQDAALYNWNPHTMLAINYVMRNSKAREQVAS
jgi:hypothetical protein